MAMLITNFNKIIQSKIVWGLFIGLVVFAFVAMDMATPDAAPQQQANDPIGTVFGEEVTRAQFDTAYRNVYLIYSIMTGQALQLDEQTNQALNDAAWSRLAVLHKAKEMGYTATPDRIIAAIKNLPIFRNQQTGQYDPNAYNAFISNFLPRLGMDAQSFEGTYAENIIIEQAVSIASQGAIVTDEEINETFHLLNDLVTVETALISQTAFTAEPVTAAAAQTYYDQNPTQFELPEKARVHYVQFDVADYTDQVQITEEMITQVYSNNLERYRVEADPENSESTASYLPLSQVRGAIEPMVRAELARQIAFNAADELVAALADEATDFETQASALQREVVKNIPPFSANETAFGIDPTAPFSQATFNLDTTPTQYYSDPVVGRDHVYVIALQKKLPAFVPAFDIVKTDAQQAAQAQADATAFREKVNQLYTQVQTALQDGTPFAAATQTAGLTHQTLAPFNNTQPLEHPEANALMERTYELPVGQLAAPVQTTEGVLLASVKERQVADEAGLAEQRPRIEAALLQRKQADLVTAWQDAAVAEANIEKFEIQPES